MRAPPENQVWPRYKMESPKLPHPWTLWYHHPDDSDWSQSSYLQVGTVETPVEFWSLVDGISRDAWENGMFFFMKKGVRPLWDVPENERGGAWSKKVDAADTHTVFVDCMVHCLANKLLKSHNDTVAGVTVSPKGNFHIIKVWNTTTTVSDRKLFSPSLKMKLGDDIAYKAHNLRPK